MKRLERFTSSQLYIYTLLLLIFLVAPVYSAFGAELELSVLYSNNVGGETEPCG